jgi:hypothetical protein
MPHDPAAPAKLSDIQTYANCMEKVRQRISAIRWLVYGVRLRQQEFFLEIEMIFLQLRKTLELIAFASLSANREAYSAAYADFERDGRAKRLLEKLEKVNPDFYPVPMTQPVTGADGAKHFSAVADGFLTKDEFAQLFDAASEVLHMRNPFATKDPAINVVYPVDEWVTRIQRLLAVHIAHLLNGEKWVVTIPDDGPVKVFRAVGTDEGATVAVGESPQP